MMGLIGMFSAIVIVVAFSYYLVILAVVFFLLFHVDGIIASLTHNRHKKLFMKINAAMLCLTIVYFFLEVILGGLLFRGIAINMILAALVPVWIFNMVVLRFCHKGERRKVKFSNIVCASLAIIAIISANRGIYHVWEVKPVELCRDMVADEYQQYANYYRINKKTVMSYTYDDGHNPDKVYNQLKKRLEKKDSDINERDKQKPYYAILNVCQDRGGRHSSRRYDMLKLLVEHGADVNVQDENRENTVLRLSDAIQEDDDLEEVYRCFQLLIENDATVNVGASDGRATALDRIDYLIENDIDYDDRERESLEKIRTLLLDSGAMKGRPRS